MLYTVLLTSFCFLLAMVGAGVVFLFKKNENTNVFLSAFSSGIMLASGVFSLIIPSIEYCAEFGIMDYIVLPVCFVLAGVMFALLEITSAKANKSSNVNTKMLAFGVLLHNIPEGMCVGFAFASVSVLGSEALMGAVLIALGIAIQNIPEGSAVAFSLYSNNVSKKKSFLFSLAVAFIEVPAGVAAYLIGTGLTMVLPYMLAFSGATMIIISTAELMPEAICINKKKALVWMLVGFILMMILDLALG